MQYLSSTEERKNCFCRQQLLIVGLPTLANEKQVRNWKWIKAAIAYCFRFGQPNPVVGGKKNKSFTQDFMNFESFSM